MLLNSLSIMKAQEVFGSMKVYELIEPENLASCAMNERCGLTRNEVDGFIFVTKKDSGA